MFIKSVLSVLSVIVFMVTPFSSFAQEAEVNTPLLSGTPITESVNLYEISRYPQNWTITRDWSGNLMVGTLGNYMIFDGSRWSTKEIPGRTVRAIHPGFNNRIYVGGTNEFGYLERDDSKQVDSLEYVSLRKLVPDEFSRIDRVHKVITSDDSTVFYNSTFHSFQFQNDSLNVISDDVWVFRLFDVDGTIVSNDSLGLSIYDDTSLTLIPGADEFEYTGIYCVLPSGENQFIFTVDNRGLFRYDGNSFSEIESSASEFAKQHSIYSCEQLPDNSYLLGTTDAGALRFTRDGEILGWYNEENGLPENRVYDIHVEFDGTTWLSHFNHISKMDFGLPVRVINESSGFNSLPFSMVFHGDDIYLGTQTGVYSGNQDLNFQYDFSRVVASNTIMKLIQSEGQLLMYSNRELYDVEEPEKSLLTFPALTNKLETSVVNSDVIFAASGRGLYIIDQRDDLFKATNILSELNFDGAHFEQDEHGNLWVSSESGNLISITFEEVMGFLETGSASITEYDMPDGWRGDGSRQISLARVDNEILLGTPRGLYRIDQETDTVVEDSRFGEWSRINEDGNPNPIFRLVADDEGNVWIRGSRSYQYAEKLPDGSYQIHHNVLKRIDDDVSNDIVAMGDGKAWFLGSKGLIYYDHNLVRDRDLRSPIISRVTVNRDSLVYRGYSRVKSENSLLELDYENNDLRFEFGFPDFSSFEGNQYQVKLEGFDNDWAIWSEEALKDYTQVREGRYTFLVRAKDATGIITQTASLPIRIFPPWYRTLWAYFLYLCLITLMLYSIHRYRINKILAIQKVRNRIASDLHDEVSSTLSSITFFTEAIEKNKEKEKSSRYLKLISTSAGEAKEKMSDIIWSIDPEHDNWENLITKCKRFASDLFESKNIQYSMNFPEQINGKIEIEMRQNIWLMFKELITNIVRHSEAKEAEIDVRFAGKYLHLTVKDTGKGFEVNNDKKGNGLDNIRNRAKQLKGSAVVDSKPEIGTVWKIKIPV